MKNRVSSFSLTRSYSSLRVAAGYNLQPQWHSWKSWMPCEPLSRLFRRKSAFYLTYLIWFRLFRNVRRSVEIDRNRVTEVVLEFRHPLPLMKQDHLFNGPTVQDNLLNPKPEYGYPGTIPEASLPADVTKQEINKLAIWISTNHDYEESVEHSIFWTFSSPDSSYLWEQLHTGLKIRVMDSGLSQYGCAMISGISEWGAYNL